MKRPFKDLKIPQSFRIQKNVISKRKQSHVHPSTQQSNKPQHKNKISSLYINRKRSGLIFNVYKRKNSNSNAWLRGLYLIRNIKIYTKCKLYNKKELLKKRKNNKLKKNPLYLVKSCMYFSHYNAKLFLAFSKNTNLFRFLLKSWRNSRI